MGDIFQEAYQILKSNSFKRKGTAWNKSVDDVTWWVINFQKSRFGTKEEFDLTINVGVYIKGSMGILFGKEPEFIAEPDCFFRQRPRFFGMDADWWKFDKNHDHAKLAGEIAAFLGDIVIPFLNNNKEIDKLVSYLPMEKWTRNQSSRAELLFVAVSYLILGYKDIARDMLKIIAAEKHAWGEKADRILKEMDVT